MVQARDGRVRVPAGGAAAGSSFSGKGSAVAGGGEDGEGEGDPWDMAFVYMREKERSKGF